MKYLEQTLAWSTFASGPHAPCHSSAPTAAWRYPLTPSSPRPRLSHTATGWLLPSSTELPTIYIPGNTSGELPRTAELCSAPDEHTRSGCSPRSGSSDSSHGKHRSPPASHQQHRGGSQNCPLGVSTSTLAALRAPTAASCSAAAVLTRPRCCQRHRGRRERDGETRRGQAGLPLSARSRQSVGQHRHGRTASRRAGTTALPKPRPTATPGTRKPGGQDLGTAVGELPPFPLPRSAAGSPLTPHQWDQCPGMPRAGSGALPAPHSHGQQPPRAVPATTETGDKQHCNGAKVKEAPRTQLPRDPQPPSAPGHHASACPASPGAHPEIARLQWHLLASPPRYFTQLGSKTKQKKPAPPLRAGRARKAPIRQNTDARPGGGRPLGTICTGQSSRFPGASASSGTIALPSAAALPTPASTPRPQ